MSEGGLGKERKGESSSKKASQQCCDQLQTGGVKTGFETRVTVEIDRWFKRQKKKVDREKGLLNVLSRLEERLDYGEIAQVLD